MVRDHVEEEGQDLAEALGEGVADGGPPAGGEDEGLELLGDDGQQLQQQRQRPGLLAGAALELRLNILQKNNLILDRKLCV